MSAAVELEVAGVRLGAVEVLGPIRLAIAAGETVALVGPSGVGKTTLGRIVLGLLAPAGATVVFTPAEPRVAAVFQEPRLLPWRTVEENVRLAVAAVDRHVADRREGEHRSTHRPHRHLPQADPVLDLLARLGLADKAAATPGELSLGLARRVALARALAVRPDVLVLDEPFASLDAATAAEARAVFGRVRAETAAAVLLVTHDAADAAELADRVVVLGGRPATIRAERRLAPAPAERSDADRARLAAEIAGLV